MAACPELLQYSLQCNLFTPSSQPNSASSSSNTPKKMAERFNVPYLGRLPMDPNLLNACESGVSFLDEYPVSPARNDFQAIVNKIVEGSSKS